MLRTTADRIGFGLLVLLILLVCGDLYVRMYDSPKTMEKGVILPSPITTMKREVKEPKAEVVPSVPLPELGMKIVSEYPPKGQKRMARNAKPKSVLLFPVPPSQPARTPDEVKTVLRSNVKFRNAIQEGLCLALNDFRFASGTMKVQIIVPWNGGNESVKVDITWNDDVVQREFTDYELSEQERANAAKEVANTLTEIFKDVANEELFPPRGGGDKVAASITRRFTWIKSASACDSDPDSGT